MEQPYYIPKQSDAFLQLERPIVFFDLETTGTTPATDRIVELCAIKLLPDGTQKELYHLINPTIPIPAGATAIHGISDADVAGKPAFGELLDELEAFFSGCDLGGYNIRRFDVPMLMEEFHRFKRYPILISEVKLVDVMGIFHAKEKRDLAGAVRFYCNRAHEGAHGARADILATIDVLKQQLLRYEDLQPNTSFLHDFLSQGNLVDPSGRFIRNAEGVIIFNFGKHYGKPAEAELEYLEWMLKGAFTVDTKLAARRIIMNGKWKQEVKSWLQKQGIRDKKDLVAALYTTLKSGTPVFPFSITTDGGKRTLHYTAEPMGAYTFAHRDAEAIMLHLLDSELEPKSAAASAQTVEAG